MINLIKLIARITKTIILSLALVCLVIFLVNNRDNITIQFYPLPFEIETKTFLAMIFFFIFGLLFGILICSKSLISNGFKRFADGRKIKKLSSKKTD